MQITSQTNNTNLSFQKFIKIKGPIKDLKNFRTELREKNEKEFINFIVCKKKKQSCLYLFTGKDCNKLINLLKKENDFFKIRFNIEKFMPQKPKTFKLKNIYENLKDNNFKL